MWNLVNIKPIKVYVPIISKPVNWVGCCSILLSTLSKLFFPSRHSWLGQSQKWEHLSNVWNLFKVNNRNIRTRCEICSKLTIKTPKHCQWRYSGVFIVNFKQISYTALGFPLFYFEQVNVSRTVSDSFNTDFEYIFVQMI